MSIPQAVSQLLEIEDLRKSGTLDAENTLAVAMSRVGGGEHNETIVAGTLAQLRDQPGEAFGEPLHSLVIVGKRLHHLEAEYAQAYAIDESSWRHVAQHVYNCTFD
jgi:diphthine methyl ester synthase